MKHSFNLSKYRKQANYDDGKGLMQQETRCFSNCQKAKREAGKGAQEAWQGCLKEFQTMKGGDWSTAYSGHDGEAALKQAAKANKPLVKKAVELPGGGISQCKDCGHKLTNDVRTCPSCGKSNPNYWKAHGE